MTRLPQPGSDDGTWGDILNDYLAVEHNSDGSLKRGADIDAAKSSAQSAQQTATNAQSAVADKYTKPSGGIPAGDLDSAVNAYLADSQTAVQSVNGKTGQAVSVGLTDLSDVSISGIQDGQVLAKQGSTWTPASFVAGSQVGANSGVASLDSSGKLPSAQLPASAGSGGPPAAMTIDSRDPAGNPTSVTEGGVTTTYSWNTDGTPATETRAGVTRTFTYSDGKLTGGTV